MSRVLSPPGSPSGPNPSKMRLRFKENLIYVTYLFVLSKQPGNWTSESGWMNFSSRLTNFIKNIVLSSISAAFSRFTHNLLNFNFRSSADSPVSRWTGRCRTLWLSKPLAWVLNTIQDNPHVFFLFYSAWIYIRSHSRSLYNRFIASDRRGCSQRVHRGAHSGINYTFKLSLVFSLSWINKL